MINRDERLLFGHLWAVAGASLLLLISASGKSTVADWMLVNFSLGTFFGVLAIYLLEFSFAWLLFFIFTWLTATLPFVIVFLIAEKFSIRNVWYYLVCGMLTGIVATPVFTARGGTLPILSFEYYERWITDAPLVASCGAFGGLVYWWKAGRWAGAMPPSSDSVIPK